MGEVKVSFKLNVNNGNYRNSFAPPVLQIDQNNLGANSGIVEVGDAQEDLAFVDIGTEGLLILQNLGEFDVVYGPKESGGEGNLIPFGRLKPNEINFVRMEPSTVLRWHCLAGEESSQVYYLILED